MRTTTITAVYDALIRRALAESVTVDASPFFANQFKFVTENGFKKIQLHRPKAIKVQFDAKDPALTAEIRKLLSSAECLEEEMILFAHELGHARVNDPKYDEALKMIQKGTASDADAVVVLGEEFAAWSQAKHMLRDIGYDADEYFLNVRNKNLYSYLAGVFWKTVVPE